jgi:hypothetical protein
MFVKAGSKMTNNNKCTCFYSTEFIMAIKSSIIQVPASQPANAGSGITNGREPRSCLGRVFNFKLGSFADNTKIVLHANGHF